MRRRDFLKAGTLAAIATYAASRATFAADTEIELSLGAPGAVISPQIYGHFIEHLGSCVYGGLWVGKNSHIPNLNGYRKRAVEYLQALGIPVLRWPGGCFADDYHWRDGIGPAAKRPKRVNINWGNYVEDNSFGTHEFLDFCEVIGADAYVASNVDNKRPGRQRLLAKYRSRKFLEMRDGNARVRRIVTVVALLVTILCRDRVQSEDVSARTAGPQLQGIPDLRSIQNVRRQKSVCERVVAQIHNFLNAIRVTEAAMRNLQASDTPRVRAFFDQWRTLVLE